MPTVQATRKAWISGAILGGLVWLSLSGIGDFSVLAGLFLGLVSAVVLALFLIWLSLGGDGADGSEWEPEVLSEPGQVGLESLAAIEPQSQATTGVRPAADKAADPKPAKAGTDKGKTQHPDDLKQIKGIGPKLEELLHENGVTHFAQIAAWDDAQIEHYAELIGRMGGRIRSDDWVAQARTLAQGGETEFSARVEKGGVY
ncbi:hypothetical protein H4P12_01420 [Paracoccus sp. 11-3]|uniref:Uncharacterized protein n=1 Tax=Paracoccus amoyensis TaxID=2760093 RepID=A0A926G481_9RHOB|nr:hypothetical protein [Paracoccus amoyensis]MBC9245398.1 hypothetical protein [Paracoccus amoyensis]